jgi:hypothetical protein
MRRIRITKPRLGAFAALSLITATAVGVLAYFGAVGTGTASVTTGSAPATWQFIGITNCATSCASGSSATGGPLSPGVNTDEIDFDVKNTATTDPDPQLHHRGYDDGREWRGL